MGGVFDKDENFRDRNGNEPEVFGFIWLITLGAYAFMYSTGLLSFLVVGFCVFATGYSFFWLRHIIKKRDKTIEELKNRN